MSDIKSRTDAYLAYALRETDTYPAPQTRLDEMLIELAEAVRLGGASPDTIKQAVDDYLTANPPAGMTDEQIADSVNDSIANGDIQVGTVLTTDQINNINDVPALAEEISDNKITGAAIVNDELVISLGDGSSINAGDVVSDPYVPVVGTVVSVPSTEPAKVTIVNDTDTNESTFNFEIPKGEDGLSPTITQAVDENDEYRLDITDQNGTYRTPNLKGVGDNIILGTDIVGEQSGVVFEVVGSKVGDMYFNTDNGNIYERDDANSVLNSWAFKGNVRGLQGKSNYELACEHGFVGTEQDYLDSLVGEGSEVKVVSARPELSDDDVELKVWYYYQVDNSGEDSAWKYRLDLPNTADYPSGDYAVYFNMKPYCGTFSVGSPALTNKDTHKYYIIMDLQAVTSTVIEESIADGTKNILEVVQCTQEEPNGHTVISYPITELGKWVQTIYIGATKDTASEVTLSTGTSVNGFVTFESLSELVGNRSNLQTVNKNNIVEAINELDTLLRYNNTAVLNTTAQDVVGAINELKASTNKNIFMLQNENVLTHALTYDPLTSNEFYAFDCSGLPNTMRYGYCRVNVSQDPLYRDISFECPTSGRTYVNTIGADPDDPTLLGEWSGWHVSLLEEDMKDKIATVLDNTVTNEQVAGAKAVYDGLESINEFKVNIVNEILDLNDITETGIYFFSQAYTPANIPVGVNGWLVVMKGSGSNIVKQVWYRQGTANANTYNTFERYKGGDTWSEWTKFLTEKDYYSALNSGNTTIPENADLDDYVTPGVYTCIHGDVAKTLVNCPHITSNFKLIVNKNRGNSDVFYGYQMIVGTVGTNPVKDVCIYYRGAVTTSNNVCTFSKWKIMSGSTVADVNETSIEFDETALGLTIVNNHSLYKVINGICYVTIEISVVPPTENKIYGYTKISTTSIPKIGFSTKATLNVIESNSSISAVLDRGDTIIKLHGNILAREGSCIIQGSFSYPVAE